jgi:Transposase IS66 family
VQPRHPEQTSDALGAAAVQLGPRVVALAAWLSKGLGLSAGKIARVLAHLGVAVTPGGVTQAVARAARRAAPTYAALIDGIQASPVVAPDETGWRVAGRRAWLWAFVGQGVVCYRIAAGRGFDDAAVVLGEGFAGVLERDGWAPYRKFTRAAPAARPGRAAGSGAARTRPGRVRPCHPRHGQGPVSPTRHTPRPKVRYRVMVAELVGDTATVVMETTGAGFHAAVGEPADGRLLAQHGVGGESHLLEHLAQLIADHPTGRHRHIR